ncbi:hypothetical protein BC833DRAFT_649277 [Globomyces pollinis-pini]|nr:hypothetical protein BC833DRAFT_649277 [Globomyces pollinis-pini]
MTVLIPMSPSMINCTDNVIDDIVRTTPNISTDDLIEKYQSKIALMEKRMSNMENEHANSILSLHAEIERLSTLCSEMMFQMALEGLPSPQLSKTSSKVELSKENELQKTNSSVLLQIWEERKSILGSAPLLDNQSEIKLKSETSNDEQQPIESLEERQSIIDTSFNESIAEQVDSLYSIGGSSESIATDGILLDNLHDFSNENSAVYNENSKENGTVSDSSEVNSSGSIKDSEPSFDSSKEVELSFDSNKETEPSFDSNRETELSTDSIKEPEHSNLLQELTVSSDDPAEIACNNPQLVGTTENKTKTPEESLYFLVQKEKSKYRSLVQRVTLEQKRKQSEIDHLKSDMEIIKQIFNLIGFKFDVKVFQKVLESEDQRSLVLGKPIKLPKELLASVKPTLPPISSETMEKNVEDMTLADMERVILNNDVLTESIEAKQSDPGEQLSNPIPERISEDLGLTHSIKSVSKSSNSSTLSVVPPKDPPNKMASKTRSKRYKVAKDSSNVIPAIQTHNQNLDYNNRAELFLENVVYVPEEINSKLNNSLPTEKTSLPPLLDKRISKIGSVIGLASHSFNHAKTAYSGRIWRSKIIKEKQLRDLQDKSL